LTDFCVDLAALINFGFGFVLEESGSAMFELELRDGHPITVRMSPGALAAASSCYEVALAEERFELLYGWMSVLELEGENMFRSEAPELRGKRVYDVV
jgi:hypothetical protein